MVDFNISNISDLSLTVEKPSGKTIPFKLGEVFRAQIADILSSGAVMLKIKGSLVTAKTSIPLLKGFSAFLKVTSLDLQRGELKLQFLEYVNKDVALKQNAATQTINPKEANLPKLISELTRAVLNAAKKPGNLLESGRDISILRKLNNDIIKSLPQEINTLPKDALLQLKTLLNASLKISGQSIQSRLEALITILPENLKNHSLVSNISSNLLISMDRVIESPLKNILHDTGVLLEAKLRAIAELIRQMEKHGILKSALMTKASDMEALRQQVSSQTGKQPFVGQETPEELIRNTGSDAQKNVNMLGADIIKNDLKAALLKLKQFIMNKSANETEDFALKDFSVTQKETALKAINALIRDIETFQLLSKTTDSFYTFIPLNWKEILDGNLCFKKGRGGQGGASYSCRINLDLDRFGKLSAVILMLKGGFFVSFSADNPHLHAILHENSHELRESFKSKGLNLKAVNVIDVEDASMQYLERLESHENLVNIKI